MYNFFKNLLGIPSLDARNTDKNDDLKNDFKNPIWGSHEYSDDDDDEFARSVPRAPNDSFGFPVFTDPIEIHKFFESQMDEMLKRFGMFGFNNGNMFGWNDENDDRNFVSPFNHTEIDPKNNPNLRDSFLKTPGYVPQGMGVKEDLDLDGKVDANDLKNFLDSKSPNELSPAMPKLIPGGFSQSIFIRTIRRPDGTVETIKKVKDHTGKEETTITHDVIQPNSQIPIIQDHPNLNDDNDLAGTSIFKKFFPF